MPAPSPWLPTYISLENAPHNLTENPSTILCDAAYGSAIAPGHLIVKGGDGNAELATPGSNLLGYVVKVQTTDHQEFEDGYKPASTAAIIYFIPFQLPDGGTLKIRISEDGVGGNINYPTNTFVNIAAQSLSNPTTQSKDKKWFAVVQLDSSTAASSLGSLQGSITTAPATIHQYLRGSSDARQFIFTPASAIIDTP